MSLSSLDPFAPCPLHIFHTETIHPQTTTHTPTHMRTTIENLSLYCVVVVVLCCVDVVPLLSCVWLF